MSLVDRSSPATKRTNEDALPHGLSPAWHEKWRSGVRAGLAEAAAGEFVTAEEIGVVLSKYAKA
ncbi:transcriptional regulator [Agrobacterium sp. LMR679]|nr:transcriptional regulator [Agrobacterium sp. LMR679]MCZ4071739.1 transcriptional regulator [Agrobacterium sp. LMR679]